MLTVLVHQHAYADAGHVEAVKEVLDAVVKYRIKARLLLLHLHDTLGHRLNYGLMAVTHEF